MPRPRGLVTALPASSSDQPHQLTDPVPFRPDAKVLDGGQQIVSLTLDTTRLDILPSSLTPATFTVHATGTDPHGLDPGTVSGAYDVDRKVTAVRLDARGRIVIDLAHGFGVEGADPLGQADGVGRAIVLELAYAITQQQPIRSTDGRALRLSRFRQGPVVDREVDAYRSGEAARLHYRLFSPTQSRGERPLIVWLHGGGEGGWGDAQDNDLALQGNRGALGFSTPEAQRIFGGAYVLAPQATDYWLNDPAMDYSATLGALIETVAARHPVDAGRIYLAGASNGGYMVLRLAVDHPGRFAAVVPICPAVVFEGVRMFSDAELGSLRGTPTWVVQAIDDRVLPFAENGRHVAGTVGTALLSAYPDVTWDGIRYDGHQSWIYVAHNHPSHDGRHLWQWMARQRLEPYRR